MSLLKIQCPMLLTISKPPTVEDLHHVGVQEHQLAVLLSGYIKGVRDIIPGSLVFKMGQVA